MRRAFREGVRACADRVPLAFVKIKASPNSPIPV